jgi:hypothetical protein
MGFSFNELWLVIITHKFKMDCLYSENQNTRWIIHTQLLVCVLTWQESSEIDFAFLEECSLSHLTHMVQIDVCPYSYLWSRRTCIIIRYTEYMVRSTFHDVHGQPSHHSKCGYLPWSTCPLSVVIVVSRSGILGIWYSPNFDEIRWVHIDTQN